MICRGLLASIATQVSYYLYRKASPYRVWKYFFGKNWSENSEYERVEKYVIISCFIELVFLILLGVLHPLGPSIPLTILAAIATLLLFWQLSSIFGAWLYVFVVGPGNVFSPPRTLLLALINYFEIIMIFGFISFVFRFSFYDIRAINYQTFSSVLQSLRYSAGIMTTMGSNFEPHSWIGYLLFFLQICFGLLFIAVIIQRALSYFRKR